MRIVSEYRQVVALVANAEASAGLNLAFLANSNCCLASSKCRSGSDQVFNHKKFQEWITSWNHCLLLQVNF